jgi:hypothetical protein
MVPDDEWLLACPDQDRHAGDTRSEGEVTRAARAVADDLADELVAHDRVSIRIPHEPRRGVRVIHVVHV